MRKTLLSLLLTISTIGLMGQNENPYKCFGYEAPIMQNRINEELPSSFIITNSDTNAMVYGVNIDIKQRLISFFVKDGSLLFKDTLKVYKTARWISPDPAGQFFSPYLSMGNNPLNAIDPDGAESESPIFGFDGTHLGNDSEGFFGEVIYMDPSSFQEGMDHGKVLDMVSNGEAFTMNGALGNALISIHDLRNTIDNIIYIASDMYNIDLSQLYNGSVSIHTFASIYSNATWDCWESQRGATANASAYMQGDAIKVNYFVNGGKTYNRSTGVIKGGAYIASNMTHSGNIISAFVHEYLGHGNGGAFRTSEAAAYKTQRWHLSFNKVSPHYRQSVIKSYNYYNGN